MENPKPAATFQQFLGHLELIKARQVRDKVAWATLGSVKRNVNVLIKSNWFSFFYLFILVLVLVHRFDDSNQIEIGSLKTFRIELEPTPKPDPVRFGRQINVHPSNVYSSMQPTYKVSQQLS